MVIDERPAVDFVALGIIIPVFLTLVFGIVAIHDIPYNIAKARIAAQDAIHPTVWVSLFTLRAIWPFLCYLADRLSPRAWLCWSAKTTRFKSPPPG